jgi:hypothetical protein
MVNDISLVGLDARLGRLEALHRFELAGMPEPHRDSLAPSPDYRVSEPPLPDPEPCSCEEAEALRKKVDNLLGIIEAQTKENGDLRRGWERADRDRGIELGNATRDRRQRLEIERAFAAFVIETNDLGAQVCFEPPGLIEPAVGDLVLQWGGHLIGQCDRCGKRAPLRTDNPGLHETDVCAWGCEVAP